MNNLISSSPYTILALDPHSSLQDIKESYRQLSKSFHPDRQPTNNYNASVQAFQTIDNAYKIIGTPFNKAVYDHFGMKGVQILLKHPRKFKALEQQYNHHPDLRPFLITKIKHKINRLIKQSLLEALHQHIYIQTQIDFACSQQLKQQAIMKQHYYGPFLHRFNLLQNLVLPPIYNTNIQLKSQLSSAHSVIGQSSAATAYGIALSRNFGSLTFKAESLLDLEKQQHHSCELWSKHTYLNLGLKLDNEPTLTPIINFFNDTLNTTIYPLSKQLNNKALLSKNLSLETTLTPNSIQFETNYVLHKHKYYQTCLTLSNSAKKQDPNTLLIQNKFKTQFKWKISKFCSIELIATTGQNANVLEIQIAKGNSRFIIPLLFNKLLSLPKSLAILSIPLILPILWDRNYIRGTWNKKVSKAREQRYYELQEQIREFDIYAQRINQEPQYLENLQSEQNVNGLIILHAFCGESDETKRIENYYRKYLTIPHTLIYQCKEHLQSQVEFSQLIVKKSTLDTLPGFYRLDPSSSKSNLEAIVIYRFQQNDFCIRWDYDVELRIGAIQQAMKGFSLNQFLMKWFM